MTGFNAEKRRSAQPLKLLEKDRAHEVRAAGGYGEVQGAEGSDADTVDIPQFVDIEVEARVEIFAFMLAQGYKPADSRNASGRFV